MTLCFGQTGSPPVPDTVDSIRLKIRKQHPSVSFVDSSPTSLSIQSNKDVCDLNIDELDAEFNKLTLDIKNNMRDLRADPSNASKKQTILATKERMNKIKDWTSKLNTEDGRRLLDENQKDIDKRRYEIDQVLKVVKAQSSVDVCFMMDCTGSMTQYIASAKNTIDNLTKTISALFKTSPRLAFVGYRDFIDGADKLIRLDFTADVSIFQNFLNAISATGGDDTCEDVFGGIQAIGGLEWSSSNRILVHVCDAPCHGRNYYDEAKLKSGFSWDKYPDGDPEKRDVYKLLLDIKRQNVQYFSVQLNGDTEKMFAEFQLIYGPILQLDVKKPDDLMKAVSKTVTQTIMTTINNTMSTFKTTEKRKKYNLSNEKPNWNILNVYPVTITEFILPKTLAALFHPLFIGTGQGRMQIASKPFAQGSLRYAYYGQLFYDASPAVPVVYKELISADTRYNSFTAYKQHLEIHVIAQFLAELFNQAQKKVIRNVIEIVYADADIVQQEEDPTKIYQVERRLHQPMQKWNNNCGGVHTVDYSTVLQAFSHWTHHETAGRIMVVDLQGVKSLIDKKYLLTDPAIHFEDIRRYREARTNLGVKGMKEFFRTHVCSAVCQRLGLEKVKNEVDENIANELYRPGGITKIIEDEEY
ncbi:unnamed protein product [Adineta steineri]|uniref:Alpha-type protein kinase domain-containing protein n=1 Tax=Adineta steineri TaxID=433720 RepID=A0A815K912_9BILA|nr:unnamed protein product [Adineta steineri]CAF4019888.1 unnamed protein product [Adineta steineri]